MCQKITLSPDCEVKPLMTPAKNSSPDYVVKPQMSPVKIAISGWLKCAWLLLPARPCGAVLRAQFCQAICCARPVIEKDMSSSGSPPSGSQTEVAETSQEMLPEDDGRGGEIHGAGGQSASTSRAHDRAPPRPSQGRRRGGGGLSASQRAPDSDGEEAGFINIDLLIDEVREREPLWNMADRRHADSIVTRRLWDEVCHAAVEGWGELNSRGQKKQRDKLQKRWRSIRDRFKKELNQEMQAPSGSGGRRSKYRYFRALSFLRTTMVCRSTVCSTQEPASNPIGAIPEQSATGEHRREKYQVTEHNNPHGCREHEERFSSCPNLLQTHMGLKFIPLERNVRNDAQYAKTMINQVNDTWFIMTWFIMTTAFSKSRVWHRV
ncbi:uncharacterized protein ACNLHF_022669 [Anomaloglossus baeobatrachus]|uniref:uncharacterized protein LOC142243864 n=1 Tax=Anomaloglossus baeobatrachus TaxID=238106 RepID=UPI003F5007F0